MRYFKSYLKTKLSQSLDYDYSLFITSSYVSVNKNCLPGVLLDLEGEAQFRRSLGFPAFEVHADNRM